jgi:hypothetical protein
MIMDVLVPRQLIEDTLDSIGLDPESDLRADYGGRNMYGATCLGIVCSLAEYGAFLVELSHAYSENEDMESDFAQDFAQRARSDSMGRGEIFYFPGVKLEAEDDDSADVED